LFALFYFFGKKPRTFKVFSSCNVQIFSKRLSSLIPYTKFFHDIHLSKPQWWKIRFAHLDKSEDEVKEIAKSQLLDWQKATCESSESLLSLYVPWPRRRRVKERRSQATGKPRGPDWARS
jgi:hypothetical protein